MYWGENILLASLHTSDVSGWNGVPSWDIAHVDLSQVVELMSSQTVTILKTKRCFPFPSRERKNNLWRLNISSLIRWWLRLDEINPPHNPGVYANKKVSMTGGDAHDNTNRKVGWAVICFSSLIDEAHRQVNSINVCEGPEWIQAAILWNIMWGE